MNEQLRSGRLAACILTATTTFALVTAQAAGQAPASEYLGDAPGLVISQSQAWGELGWNVAAHAGGQAGLPLQIGEKTYARGLGHHANGSITISLDGQYASFDADVGLQPCDGGSVIFSVLVDGEKRFDSGIMRSKDAPKPVHVELAGAQELVLEANDAGDGITCDMANWAEARLTRALVPAPQSAESEPLDVGRFARVVTWDPDRMDGARASRIEEFQAEDLFPETDAPREADGTYRVPTGAKGLACIGLQWLNRRALKMLALEFPDATAVPPTNAVQVQGWFGESAWQGGWKPLAGRDDRNRQSPGLSAVAQSRRRADAEDPLDLAYGGYDPGAEPLGFHSLAVADGACCASSAKSRPEVRAVRSRIFNGELRSSVAGREGTTGTRPGSSRARST